MSDARTLPHLSLPWRPVRRVAYAVFLLWFAWYAYTRFTTPPAIIARRSAALALPDDDGLGSALVAFRGQVANSNLPSVLPVFTSSTPTTDLATYAGKAWTQLATNQPTILTELAKADVTDRLDRIVELCTRRLSGPSQTRWRLPELSGDPLAPGEHDAAIVWLTVRARSRVHDGSDFAGAVADLRAALLLGELADIKFAEQPRWMYGGRVANALPLLEVSCVATEIELPPPQCRELIRLLRDDLGLSLTDALTRRSVQADAAALLDRYYTDDGRGNGWLVLSAAIDRPWSHYSSPPGPHNRLWNLASCFYNDRRTMAARLSGLNTRFQSFDQRSYEDILREFNGDQSFTLAQRGGSVFDGPLTTTLGELEETAVQNAMIVIARRRAAVVLLALNTYFVENEQFPESLDALVPRYLDSLPLDANASAPFGYVRQPGAGFNLSSRGSMAVDQAAQWWFPVKFPQESYTPAREYNRLKSRE